MIEIEPIEFWRHNSTLRDITPRNERFPEVGLEEELKRACIGKAFEFGCGDGRLSGYFSPDNYYGFDVNPYALKLASLRNPQHKYGMDWNEADTFLAHTVLLHIPDNQIQEVINKAKQYKRIVIGEIMGRKWRRDGNPPVFNREIQEYIEMVGREPEIVEIPYPRYKCNLHMLVFK